MLAKLVFLSVTPCPCEVLQEPVEVEQVTLSQSELELDHLGEVWLQLEQHRLDHLGEVWLEQHRLDRLRRFPDPSLITRTWTWTLQQSV